MSICDEIDEYVNKMTDELLWQEMKDKQQVESAVIICNRENKIKLKSAMPNLCVFGTDLCDEKIYMVTDRTIANNIRENLRHETFNQE